jgi:tellurite resistance protein
MKLSKDMQKDILLQSFEVLKSDFEANDTEIAEAIGQMADIDIDIAFDMWEYILDSNPNLITDNEGYINDNKAYCITSKILFEINRNIGYINSANAIKTRTKIKEAIFKKSANIDGNQCSIISQYISEGDLETANEILSLVTENKYNKGKGFSETLGGIFQTIIDELDSDVDENSIEFLHYWIQQIKNPTEKAKATIRLMKLMK